MAQTIYNSIVINHPVNEVFAYVTDPATTPQWQANLVRSEIQTPGPMRIGAQILEVRRLGKWESRAMWEVTEYEPPAKRGYVYTQGFGPIRQSGITTFEQVEEGTLLRFTAHMEARFPLKLLLPLLARLMRRQNDKSFAVLASSQSLAVSSKNATSVSISRSARAATGLE